jgi:outer membrane protein assembly factor BamB
MKKIVFASAILMIIFQVAESQALSQWRGVNRDGIYAGTSLLKSWPAGGPQLLWFTSSIGNGFGSPSISGNRLYITGELDSSAWLFCFDLSGKLIWKSQFGKEWVRSFPGSRSAPTVTKDLVYVASGFGNIYCFDASDGSLKWNNNMLKDLHGTYILHGHAESILLDEDKLFFTPGGRDTNVVALNRFTGKLIWSNKGRGERPGYNSPVLIQLPARKVMVTFSAYSLMGFDTETGKMLWFHEQDNTPLDNRQPGYGDTHSNSVLYENGYIYYIAGDGNCAVKLELSADGSQIKQIWRNNEIDNFMGGFVKLGNFIYTSAFSRKDLRKLDSGSGAAVDSLKCGAGTIISADGMLYYYNDKGQVYLINPNGPRMEITGNFKVDKGTKEHFSHPVIDRGVLYIRHGNTLLAYKLKA